MTNFTVGRVGLDIDISSINGWDDSSSQGVTITGQTNYGSLSDAQTIRQQLMGYVDSPDEEFVPVTWADRPSINGFYTIQAASITANSDGEFAGVYDFSISMTRVQGFASPSFESVILGALRANASGIVTGTTVPWHGLRATVSGYDNGVVTPTTTTRVGADGNVSIFSDAGNTLYNSRPAFYLPPSSWYQNACVLKTGVTSTVAGAVATGRQVANLPSSWEINNGLVRVRKTPTTSAYAFEFAAWDSGTSAWIDYGEWSISTNAGGSGRTSFNLAPTNFVVLRNSPEEVAIRLTWDAKSVLATSRFAVNVDLTLRRGARTVNGVVTMRNSSYTWGVNVGPAYTASALTAGQRFVSTFGTPTWAWVMGSSLGGTLDPTIVGSGIIANAATSRYDFCIGIVPGYAGATGLETPQSLIYQYMAAQNEKVTVVAR